MPIKPENRAKYGPGWRKLSASIRHGRASGQCEWIDPETGQRCQRRNGEPIPGNETRRTVLTVAHLDHNPANNDPANLRAWCQKHHLRYDAALHAEHAATTRRRQRLDNMPPNG